MPRLTPKSRSRYYKYNVTTNKGKRRTGIYWATSTESANKGISRYYKNPKKIKVFKTAPYKLK